MAAATNATVKSDLQKKSGVRDPAAHLARMASLLALERAYEIDQTRTNIAHLAPTSLQKRGLCLLSMRVTATRTGLGGKVLAEFERDSSPLPPHSMRVGDVVGIIEGSGKGAAKKKGGDDGEPASCEGVLTKLEETRITIAFKDDNEGGLEGKVFRINKLANDISYARMSDALSALQTHVETNTLSPLFQVLLEGREPSFRAPDDEDELQMFNENLNDSQKNAVVFAQRAQECALIHGPPGTGKTETIVEVIRQFVKKGMRVLVCGPSNISVDNIVERLAPSRLSLIRIGHPARVLPACLEATLDVQLKTSDAAALVLDIRAEIDANLKKIGKTKSRSERKTLWQQNRDLRKDLKQREKGAIRALIDGANVVLCTLNGAGGKNVRFARPFDVAVIDEATQALEPETWIALLQAPKAILAGDHKQLPPTVKCPDATAKGFERTVFDNLLHNHGEGVKVLLDTQYRMHDSIMNWSSGAMYEGLLKSHDAVRQRLLCDLAGIQKTDETATSLMLVDTAGCDIWENVAEDGESRYNQGEAALVQAYLKTLLAAGVRAADIAIISPYNGQVALIKSMVRELEGGELVEVGSVDGFQGREKEAIIISLVRSNPDANVGFLKESRRLNVAITRAKRHVCLICDSETIERGDPFLKGIMEWFFEHGEVLPAQSITS
ncbi:hypothetical protein PhCBS80983_g00513 [Powellomyces hirtus]|uniref:DNA helicase n=1 Tax=Powellomyces hirtus TaxID=109895 RepID=A0A507EFT7_9FUNG|nr:hypothetical protein PhCBS80983_g00513 [Powellomyces hirtus]